jgi:hypothetical protein
MIFARSKFIVAFAILGFACAGSVSAKDAGCFHLGAHVDELGGLDGVLLAEVNNLSSRAHFVKSDVLKKGCPNTSLECREKEYLVSGDEVVVLGGTADFVCAGYVGKNGNGEYNWLPRAALTLVQQRPAIELRDWAGSWRNGEEQKIRISQIIGSNKLKIEGNATTGQGRYTHVGGLDAEVIQNGASLSFGMGEFGTLSYEDADEVDCRVRMRRLGPYLLVKDNLKCGDANVSFSDVYRR